MPDRFFSFAKTFLENALCLRRAKRVMPTDFPTEFDIPLKLFPFSAELAWRWGISGTSAVSAGDFLQGPKNLHFVTFERRTQLRFRRLHIYMKMFLFKRTI